MVQEEWFFLRRFLFTLVNSLPTWTSLKTMDPSFHLTTQKKNYYDHHQPRYLNHSRLSLTNLNFNSPPLLIVSTSKPSWITILNSKFWYAIINIWNNSDLIHADVKKKLVVVRPVKPVINFCIFACLPFHRVPHNLLLFKC